MMENFNQDNFLENKDRSNLEDINKRLAEINPILEKLESLVPYGDYLVNEKIYTASTDPLDIELIEDLDKKQALMIDLQTERDYLEKKREDLLRGKNNKN